MAGLRERLEAAARVSVVHPTLAMPSLAGAGGEAVNASTVAFLSREAVQERMAEESKKKEAKKLEEEQQAMRVEEEDPSGWQQALVSDGVQYYYWHRRTRRAVWTLPAFASKRKRKNKRRRRMRKSRRRFTEEAHFAQLLFMMSQRFSLRYGDVFFPRAVGISHLFGSFAAYRKIGLVWRRLQMVFPMSQWCLAVTGSVSASLDVFRKIGIYGR